MHALLKISASLLLVAAPVAAQERHAEHHDHGEAHLSIAADGPTLVILLEASGADIVGFEVSDGSDAHAQAVADALAMLADPFAVLIPDAAANCQVDSADVIAGGYDTGHRHDAGEGHAGFEASYALTCPDGTPVGFAVTLFDTFPAIELVDVQAVGPSGALSAEVGPGERTFSW